MEKKAKMPKVVTVPKSALTKALKATAKSANAKRTRKAPAKVVAQNGDHLRVLVEEAIKKIWL